MKKKLISAIYSIIESAKENKLLGELDDISAKNSLFHIFQIEDEEFEIHKRIDDMRALKILYEYNDLDLPFEKFVSRIMGEVTPRNSEVISKFNQLMSEGRGQKAIDWYYKFCQYTKYIRMDRVTRNKKWKYSSKYGDIEITINLSKPEKDPRDIIKSGKEQSNNYPKCVLCKENVGYKGRPGYPERSNHRIIPLKLNDEKWYLQFSPYVYYNQHLIVLSYEHTHMNIDHKTIERLLDFVEIFPKLFIGSNAELPIVGGSILSHNHFQGGNYTFPIEKARVFDTIDEDDYKIEILDWPVSTIRVVSRDREKLKEKSFEIIRRWDNYKNKELQIIPFTNNEKHNTVTLIMRKKKERYILYITFRNNRCNEEYPYGIFHTHEENHHIKKENIGLIEVMGLAILPRRLDNELEEIKQILLGKKNINKEDPHRDWILQLKDKYDERIDIEEIGNLLENEVGNVFVNILENCGVFKRTDYDEFKEFIDGCIK
ncbi:UDP-glucose--hexose-1-phosphate uridylyltransferase [Schnuerera sp. xch1]|uniref:UDP-glucose--hexose-1-phosphate uridylyltransferase n=1 Tax=Schnuerera sp. xch1 TaxID=2874283 RepID=UPI001CBB3DEB|nr:UDP-glucose--hexose-1-phosphate uridylyltransferase [Schnuerera sp. xch1]MBZ2174513.1 UDP-glucose--hexose-1-phosphate uridylyltransferase [Schnuerera sp. xch1]